MADGQALKRETDAMSKQRRSKLEEEVALKKQEEKKLMDAWQVGPPVLSHIVIMGQSNTTYIMVCNPSLSVQ